MNESHVIIGIYEHAHKYYKVYGISEGLNDPEDLIVSMREDMDVQYPRPLKHVALRFFEQNFQLVQEHF